MTRSAAKRPSAAHRALFTVSLALTGILLIAAPVRADATLYDDLGGEPGVKKLVDATFAHALSDDRIKATFDQSDMNRVRKMFAQQVCQLSGGPCVYKGHTMPGAHRGLHLTTADFNALVEDLQMGMDETNIPYRVQNRLLALLAPMEPQVVTR